MATAREISQSKTLGDLGREAFWFLTHTLFAVLVFALVIGCMSLTQPDPDSLSPKLVGTALAFAVPLFGGFVIARMQQNAIARYVWISGLLLFSVVCVWVLDLPTGNGLCEECVNRPVEKLIRTFFDIKHGSGLMGGEGLLVGTWLPLSMIGYAVGAAYGLHDE